MIDESRAARQGAVRYPGLDRSLGAVWTRAACQQLVAELGGACTSCRHYGCDHLVYLGPFKACMTDGCDCGRRSLKAMVRAVLPFLPVIVAVGYMAYQLVRWAAVGFVVIG